MIILKKILKYIVALLMFLPILIVVGITALLSVVMLGPMAISCIVMSMAGDFEKASKLFDWTIDHTPLSMLGNGLLIVGDWWEKV